VAVVLSLRDLRVAFWGFYSKAAALAAFAGLAWLAYRAGVAEGAWWASPAGVALVAALLGAIAPATAFVVSWARIALEAQKQDHDIKIAVAEQDHAIKTATAQQEHAVTTDYLSRTLSSELPLATRHQLLRFLATSSKDRDRLQVWAKAELRRIDVDFEHYTSEVKAQHEAIARAKDVSEVRLAEAKLRALTAREGSARGEPVHPAPTPEAIRAGFFREKELPDSQFANAKLDGAQLNFANLAGSVFSNADLRKAEFFHANLRLCEFVGADLKGARLGGADCRGANFTRADLQDAILEQIRLEGADLTDASIDRGRPLRAVYDRRTKWPEGFDPIAAGCILVEVAEGAVSSEPS
jgi:uncharacterized protein YjbI with pentapeptide repeats